MVDDKAVQKCRICSSFLKSNVIVGREIWVFSDKRFDYFECSSCNCIQIAEYPENIADFYTEEYYSFNVNRKISAVKYWLIGMRDNYALSGAGILGGILYKIWPTNIFKNIPYPEVNQDSKILDVGCGDGSFLLNLHRLGYKSLTGIDPFLINEYSIDANFKIQKKDIYQIEGEFDCIVLKGTLEHQPDQLKLMIKIHSLLSPGGICVIRIPVMDSYAWEHYRENWVQFDAPRHFYLHSIKSMEYLAFASGLRIHHMEDDGDLLQFIGSEQLLAGIALQDPRSFLVDRKNSIFSRSKIQTYAKKKDAFNKSRKGDVMIFVLKKDDIVL